MRRNPLRARCLLAVTTAVLLSGCAPGFGLADDEGTAAPGPEAAVAENPAVVPSTPGPGVAPGAAGSTVAPPPAPDPAAVPGADRFGVGAGDDFCAAAQKVAMGFVGIFDAVYSAQAPGLQAQVDDAIVATDVLRSVAPEAVQQDLDVSRRFLARFREVLGAAGWDMAAAAAAHPDFFGGPEADAGFAAMTAVTASLAQQCGLTP